MKNRTLVPVFVVDDSFREPDRQGEADLKDLIRSFILGSALSVLADAPNQSLIAERVLRQTLQNCTARNRNALIANR